MKPRYNFTETIKENVRKYIDIRDKGYYADATALTNDYNAVFGTKRSVTHCGSCLRQMVNDLENALKAYEAWEAREAINALEGFKSAEDKEQARLSGFTNADEFYDELERLKEQMEEVAQEIGLPETPPDETPEKEEETPAKPEKKPSKNSGKK